MGKTIFNGKPAIEIEAELVIWANTNKAQMYNINGHGKWVPNSLCKFTKNGEKGERGDWKGTLLVYEWFYKKLFPEE